MAKITNTTFGNACTAYPAPFGPLVRVGDMPDQDPNEFVQIAVTSAFSVPFTISYDDLTDAPRAARIVAQAHSGRDKNITEVEHIKTIAQMVYQTAVGFGSAPYTNDEYESLITMLRMIPYTSALNSVRSDRPESFVEANFTPTAAGSSNVTFTTAITGDAQFFMWDFGDGTFSYQRTPGTKNYSSTGSKTIKLYVLGPTNATVVTKSVTVT